MTNIDNSKKTIMKNLHWPNHWKPVEDERQDTWNKAKAFPFPSRKHDDWRWVNFGDLDLESLNVEPIQTNITASNVVKIINAHQSNVADVEILEQLEATREIKNEDSFTAINQALADEVIIIQVPENKRLDETIHIRHHFSGANSAAFTRCLIKVDKGAEAKVIVKFSSDEDLSQQAFFSYRMDVWVEQGARLELIETQEFGKQVNFISHEHAQCAQNAHLNWNYIALGSKNSKSFITVDLNGSGAETLMNGVYFSGTGQLINLDTQQNHNAPNAHSDLLYKGAVIGEGMAVWEGMIYVDYEAQKTDSYQSNRNLILDDRAEIKTIPGLEINANDVSCSHGATVGRLNDDELFYSQSRGIPMREAEKLIVEGFFAEVLSKSGDEALVESFLLRISDKFKTNRVDDTA